MGEQRINYICCFCGEKEKRRISKGEPPPGICRKNEDGGSHLWVDDSIMDDESRLWLKKEKPMRSKDMYRIGCCYAMENTDAYDMAKALKWYQKAAELRNEDAKIALYLIHDTENLGVQDQKEALKWLQKWLKKKKPMRPSAMYEIGSYYAMENTVDYDMAKAVQWYQRAAELGDENARITLYFIYDTEKFGIQDQKEALKWLQKSAESGNLFAMLFLAYTCECVSETERRNLERHLVGKIISPPTSFLSFPDDICGWNRSNDFKMSMELGKYMRTNADTPYSMIVRGFAYEHGKWGVEENIEESLAWYQKASEAGDAFAMLSLGRAYDSGIGVAQDEEKACQFYRMAIAAKVLNVDSNRLPECLRDIKKKATDSLPTMSPKAYVKKFIPAISGRDYPYWANKNYFDLMSIERDNVFLRYLLPDLFPDLFPADT